MLNSAAFAPAPSNFTSFVDGLAVGLLELSPTFESFVHGMPGVLPDEALASLRRIGGTHAERLLADALTDRAPAFLDQANLLPLPHPLDSEFRFNVDTAQILAGALLDATRDGDEILLIGVPSVAVELAASGADRRFRYLGPDNCVTAAVGDAISDGRLVREQGKGCTAAAALLDPPWYPQPMRHLLKVGAFGCHPGALLNLVLPSLGTRPEIELDRETFVGFALEAGLTRTNSGGPVCYRTPLFELAALERQGIARLPNWRRGDVIGFRVGERTIDAAPWSAPRAMELTVDGVRLRLVPGASGGTENLVPISDREVFPSVSARASGRGAATLWTTTNRAFLVDPNLAQQALSAIATSPTGVLQSGLNSVENGRTGCSCVAAVESLIHQVSELIGRELFDARRLVGDDAWLKTGVEWRY
jgi:hypothetical protein